VPTTVPPLHLLEDRTTMGRLSLSLACGAYDRVRPILEGIVPVEGVDLIPLKVMPASELFWRLIRHEEFDIAEMSLSNYVMERSRGIDRFMAIPVFPHRAFRHSSLWVRSDAGIDRPEDLAGRRIGIPEYSMTMMLFVRGLLQHEYGVTPAQVTWVRARPERADYEPPSVPIEDAPPGTSLDALLLDGRVDAIVTTRVPSAARGEAPLVRRLVADPRAAEAAYLRRTGIFPIMHAIVMRREVYQANRWLATNLVQAFEKAKEIAYGWLHESQPYCSLPWLAQELESQWDVFGGDPFPYGIEPNRRTLEAATSWSFEQGLSPRQVSVEELFAPETVEPFAHHGQR
jgi:4,5-dihydroxyphthalate decarboxylase